MKQKLYAAIIPVSFLILCLWGCKPASTKQESANAASPSPSASPIPKMGAIIDSPTFALADKEGKPFAKIVAESAAATGSGEQDALGEMTKATATLYQKGKEVATLTADKLKADGKTHVLTAKGNVLVESKDNPGEKKTVRADTVRWEYDNDKIIGSNNVVLKQGDMIQIPAANFVADTALKKCNLHSSGSPITGTY